MIKKYSLSFLICLCAIMFGFGQSNIIISQYIETNSGSTPKGLEIMNVSGSDIVFSASNNLQVFQGTNGSGCVGIGVNIMSGTLRTNEVWVIGTSDLVAYAISNGVNLSGTTTYGFSFNGDDALQVRLGGIIEDVFGTCGSDPGSAWSGSGVSTANNNLQIQNGICDGDIDGWTNPITRFDQISDGSTMTGFGSISHTCSSTFSVTYDGNGSDGGTTPVDANTYNSGDSVTVLGNTFTNTCNTFNGWNTAADGSGSSYTGGSTFNIASNTTLYAQWTPTGNTVTFDSNGGTGSMPPQTNCVPTNLDSNAFTNSGFTFNSWNTAADGSGTTYADSALYNFSADITLYAQWDVFTGPCLSDDFNSGYGNWTGSGTYQNSTAGVTGNGTGFNDNNDNIVTNVPLTNPQSISFEARASSSGADYSINVEYSTSNLGPWTNAITLDANGSNTGDITTSSTTFNLNLNLFGTYYLRIIQSPRIGGSFYLDNVDVFCGTCTTPANVNSFLASQGCGSIDLSWDSSSCAEEVLVVARQTNAVTASPSGDGTAYMADTQFGNGTALLTGQFAVYKGTGTSASITGLSNGNTYHFTIFSRVGNMWSSGTSAFETANVSVDNVASFSSYNSCGDIALSWSLPICYDEVLIVARANNPVAAGSPTGDGSSYTADSNFSGTGSNLLSGKVVFKGTTPPETITGLTNGVTYHFKIFTRIGTSWSSGMTSSATAVSSGGSGPTTFIPGDLVFVGFDSYVNGATDRYSILNMVDIGVGTEFTMANLLYEYNAPAGISTGRWYNCSTDFNHQDPDSQTTLYETPYVTFRYDGCSDIPKGSIICIETSGFGTIQNISINGYVVTSDFTTLNNSSHDNDNIAGNISTTSPDAMWLMQGTFSDVQTEPDGPDSNDTQFDYFRTFTGVVLGGLQTKGNFQPFSVAGSAGGDRISRIHPDIECVYLETGPTSSTRFYGYHDSGMVSGTHYALLADITDVASNWTIQSSSSGQDGDDIASICGSSYTVTGSANIAGHWIGGVSTDWFDCKNWENFSVPKRDTDVTIDNASLTYCDIDHTSPNAAKYGYVADCQDLTISDEKLNIDSDLDILYVRDVTIQGTGALDMNHDGIGTPGSLIYLYGDWTNDVNVNAFDEGNGHVVFTGDPLDGPQVINNNVPTNTEEFYDVTIDNDFNTSTSNNLYVKGDLVVDPTNTVTISDGRYIYVHNDFTQNGTLFLIENNGYLVQGDDSGINTGNIRVERSASVDAQDYVYWSSPITNMNVNNVSPSSPTNRIYKWNPTFSNTNGTFGNWVSAAGETMVKGLGYIIRVPSGQTSPVTPGDLNFTAIFENGVPHNGLTPALQVTRGAIPGNDDQWNLLGNPYPSAIDAYTFLDENSSVLDGFVNLWTHGNPPSTAISDPFYYDFGSNYTETDYITYNVLGGSYGPGDILIASGQSFMVNMLDTAPTPSNIIFNNSMRNVSYDNSQFYRSSSQTRTTNFRDLEKHRIWLDFVSDSQPTNRILVGYAENATQDRDRMFDAIADNLNFYSLIENNAFVIQGRGLPFNDSDVIPLGYKSLTRGNYTIAIAAVDGIFDSTSQPIYLKDLLLGITYDLRIRPYTFVSEEGTFNDRFEIVFRSNALSVHEIVTNQNTISIIELDNDDVRFSIDSNNLSIKNVEIIDLTGRTVYNLKGKNNSETYNLSGLSSSTYIAKITLSNNQVVIKKAIKK